MLLGSGGRKLNPILLFSCGSGHQAIPRRSISTPETTATSGAVVRSTKVKLSFTCLHLPQELIGQEPKKHMNINLFCITHAALGGLLALAFSLDGVHVGRKQEC
eukprot:2041901-Amphidinium_carterae.1